MENENVNYKGYQNMVTQVNTGLVELEKICNQLGMEGNRQELVNSRKKLAEHKFSVGILGEFKRGKSTVINSLLGKEIMPADILPCSATMNRVTYDMKPHAEILMMDGSVKNVSVEELKNYVTKTTKDNEAVAATVEEAIVYYPCAFCQNGVDIVDTPGLNDDERMNKVTEEVIPKLDAVIMVVTHDSPFSMSEAEFVRNKIMASDVGRIIFLVNKMDTVRRASDKERILQEVKTKIQKSVMEKMEILYGADSKEYESAMQKIANIKVYPFSGLDALEGKMNNDTEMIQNSGTIEFEAALTKMLTEERGALELGTPLNIMLRTAEEIGKAATTRKEALKLSSEEFETKHKEALEEIKNIREKKKAETNRLKVSAINNKTTLTQRVPSFYSELENRLINVIENSQIDTSILKTQEGENAVIEKIQSEVSAEMKTALSEITEKTETQLREIIGTESINIGEFIGNTSASLTESMASFTNSDGSFLKSMGLEAAVFMAGIGIIGTYIPGLGGIMQGYKAAGVKGAVVGGVAAASLGYAAMVIAVSSFSVVGLPLAAIGAIVGSITGNGITSLIFGKDIAEKKYDEIRKKLITSVYTMVDEMRSKRDLENWIEQRVNTSFDELIIAMENECEKLLKDTEATMDSIKAELGKNESERIHLEQDYDEYIANTKTIMDTLQPTATKVFELLANA